MSSIGSTALQTSKQESHRTPQAQQAGPRQRAFHSGTMSMLEDARAMAENAAGQGMQLNPIIYQMLGLQPRTEDHSADLEAARQEMDAAQTQFDESQKAFDQLRGIPKGKRSKEQKKQFKQLKKYMKAGQKPIEDATARFNQLQTMPFTITGFDRMDPNDIPKESPFSAMNPLNKAQQTEAGRLNEYLAGGEVDPTLKQEYTAAEQALRAKLSERFGPDFENTSVGQMALQNFSRERNEAFATWNEQQVEKYNSLAFQGQANLQTLLANQIGLMREPSNTQMGTAGALSNLTGQRLNEEQQNLAERSARQGLAISATNYGSPAGAVGGALSSPAMQKLADAGWNGVKSGAGALYDWATGAGAGAGYAGDAAAMGDYGMSAAAQSAAAASSAAATDAAATEGGGWLASLFCCHPETLIDTPTGARHIATLNVGDEVYSLDLLGARIVAKVNATNRREINASHAFAVMMLPSNTLLISPDHPLPDGCAFSSHPDVDEDRIYGSALHTFDISVDSSTGIYFACGIPLGSTIDVRFRKAA